MISSSTYLAAECAFRRNDNRQALARFSEIVASQDPKAKEFQARAGYRGGTAAGNLKDWPTSQRLFNCLGKTIKHRELKVGAVEH